MLEKLSGSLGLDQQTIFIWLGLGLVAGIIAKFILPGKDKGGLISTMIIGIAGSFVGGMIGKYFNIGTEVGGISIMSLLTAVVGALALLIILRVLRLLI